jgi:plasmid stabilization system protein ParE
VRRRRVIVAIEVREALREATAWIRERNPVAATAFRAEAEKAIKGLAVNPERCAIAREAEALGIELRRVLFGRRTRYRIYFVIEGDSVQVVGLLHGARDDWTG